MPQQPQQQQQQSSGQPQDLILFQGFSGLDTQASRMGIADTAAAWMDGWFPIGTDKLRIIPDIGPPLFTAGANGPVAFFDFVNIGPTPYCLAFMRNGAIIAINTDTQATSVIAGPGTIQNPNQTQAGVSQWGSQYALIVANQTNGYFVWDGTNFYGAGQVIPGAGGPGPIATATVAVGGSGYAPGDTGGIVGGISDGSYIVSTVDGSGAVTAFTLGDAGSFYVTAAGLGTFLGGPQPGSGTGFTVNVTVTGSTMPSGISGTTVETFQGHVWVANGPTVFFSAPSSVTDFSTSNGGGNFTSNDSSLRVAYTKLVNSNGYLYLIGDSSVSYLANVQTVTSGSPPTVSTTFTIQNTDPEVGTVWPATVDLLGNNIIFANAWGAHVNYGGRAAKVSAPLDGVYNTVLDFGGFVPSAAKTILYGKRVWILLLPVYDLYTGAFAYKFFIWDEKRWCSTQQTNVINYIQHQEINSVLTAYGTDGTAIWPLMTTPTRTQQKVVQSRLWSVPAGFTQINASNRLWGVAITAGFGVTLEISVDTELAQNFVDIPIGTPQVFWLNNSDQTVPWLNNSAQTVTWFSSSTLSPGSIVVFPPQAVAAQGALMGITVVTNAEDLILAGVSTMPIDVQYRG